MNEYTLIAVNFLNKIHPNRYRQVIRFTKPEFSEDKSQGRPQQALITPATEGGDGTLHNFIANSREHYNLYYSLGVPQDDHRGDKFKLSKQKLAFSQWLHCDIDPDKDKPYADERERIANLIASLNDHSVIPKPTAVVFSGGGFQCLWELSEPVVFHSAADYAVIEERNNWLASQLGGDRGTFNCDRILRLPGTINWPDEKKKASGRSACLAELIYFDDDAYYALDDFQCLPIEQNKTPQERVTNSGKAKFISQISELDDYPIDDWIKTLIVRGVPNYKGNAPRQVAKRKYGTDDNRYDNNPYELLTEDLWQDSRSEGLYAVIRHLYANQVPLDVIKGVCLNDGFRISDHVYNQQMSADRYVDRQIEKIVKQMNPIDHPTDDILDPTSETYQKLHKQALYSVEEAWQYLGKFIAVGNVNGKTAVVYRNAEGEFEYQSPTEFKAFRTNKKVLVKYQTKDGEEKTKAMALGEWWWNHPERPSYESMKFAPGVELDNTTLNTWEGFTHQPTENDWSLFYEHLRFVCDNNHDYLHYLLDWMATAVQFPNEAAKVAVVLRGVKGCGKTTVFEIFGQLFGSHFQVANGAEDIVGRFNDNLRTCIVLMADEAFHAGDKRHEGRLKNLITGKQLRYEAKHANAKQGRNCLHIGISSNEDWVVPAHGKERRYFMLNVRDTFVDNLAYFNAIREQMENGGYAGLLKHLMERPNIEQFFTQPVPITTALMEQITHSMTLPEQWWAERLESAELVPGIPWEVAIGQGFPTTIAFQHYKRFVKDFRNSNPISNKAFNLLLAKWFGLDRLATRNLRLGTQQSGQSRLMHYKAGDPSLSEKSIIKVCDCPKLHQLKALFSKQHGGLVIDVFEDDDKPAAGDPPQGKGYGPEDPDPFDNEYNDGHDYF